MYTFTLEGEGPWLRHMALRGWRPVSSGAASASAILWLGRAGGSLSWCSGGSRRVLCDAGAAAAGAASSASGVGRRTTRANVCFGNAEGIAEEDWALELEIFPGLVVVLIFFGVFDASVAQASSEGWFGRVLGRRVRFYFTRETNELGLRHLGWSTAL